MAAFKPGNPGKPKGATHRPPGEKRLRSQSENARTRLRLPKPEGVVKDLMTAALQRRREDIETPLRALEMVFKNDIRAQDGKPIMIPVWHDGVMVGHERLIANAGQMAGAAIDYLALLGVVRHQQTTISLDQPEQFEFRFKEFPQPGSEAPAAQH